MVSSPFCVIWSCSELMFSVTDSSMYLLHNLLISFLYLFLYPNYTVWWHRSKSTKKNTRAACPRLLHGITQNGVKPVISQFQRWAIVPLCYCLAEVVYRQLCLDMMHMTDFSVCLLGERWQCISVSHWWLPRCWRSSSWNSLCWYLHTSQILPSGSRLLGISADWWLLQPCIVWLGACHWEMGVSFLNLF